MICKPEKIKIHNVLTMICNTMEEMRFLVFLYFLFIRKYGINVIRITGISSRSSQGCSNVNFKFVIATPHLEVFFHLQQPFHKQQCHNDHSNEEYQVNIRNLIHHIKVGIR